MSTMDVNMEVALLCLNYVKERDEKDLTHLG